MPDHTINIVCCSTRNALVFYNIFCYFIKYSTRSAFFPNLLIYALSRKCMGRGGKHRWNMAQRTYCFALTTFDTFIQVNLRIAKSLRIHTHFNTILRTYILAGATSTTFMFISYLNHIFLDIFLSLWTKMPNSKNTQIELYSL